MPLIVSHCPLCNDPHSVLFDQREFRGFQVSNQMCMNCGLVYQSPRMNEDELSAFYQAEYRQVYQGDEKPLQQDRAVQEKRAQFLLKVLRDCGFEKISRYLDIGCSTGVLLERVSEVFRSEIIGIEPGEAYKSYAEKRGLKIYAELDDLRISGEPGFDLISLIHVLEHLSKPVEYLEDLRDNWLREDGHLLIEVPNLYAHDSFEIAHLVSFSQFTLEETIKKAGFTTSVLIKHGHPRSNMIPLYITLLASPTIKSREEVNRERGTRFKRRAGLAHRRVIERLFPRQAWLS